MILFYGIGIFTGFLIKYPLKVTILYHLAAPSQEIATAFCENSFKINGNTPKGITTTKANTPNEYVCTYNVDYFQN